MGMRERDPCSIFTEERLAPVATSRVFRAAEGAAELNDVGVEIHCRVLGERVTRGVGLGKACGFDHERLLSGEVKSPVSTSEQIPAFPTSAIPAGPFSAPSFLSRPGGVLTVSIIQASPIASSLQKLFRLISFLPS